MLSHRSDKKDFLPTFLPQVVEQPLMSFDGSESESRHLISQETSNHHLKRAQNLLSLSSPTSTNTIGSRQGPARDSVIKKYVPQLYDRLRVKPRKSKPKKPDLTKSVLASRKSSDRRLNQSVQEFKPLSGSFRNYELSNEFKQFYGNLDLSSDLCRYPMQRLN